MATQKTTETNSSVTGFVNAVPDKRKRDDSFKLIEIFKEETGFDPKMWGPAIIGFGSYHYKYASGHEGDTPLVGFSPRKDAISLYLMCNTTDKDELLPILGKHKAAKACIYVKKLEDIDTNVLRSMINASVKYLNELYPRP